MSRIFSPLIAPDEVKQRLTQSNVVIVDARGGNDAMERYMAGHVDGALMISLESGLSEVGPNAADGGRHPLPDPAAFGRTLGGAGITPATHVLVYDDKAGANAAARFWWMLRAARHDSVQVIDGGLAALVRAGVPISTGPAHIRAVAGPYPITDWHLPLADIETVDRLRTTDRSLVIDVREEYRYRGESEPIDLVAGHIPGAINLPYVNNLDADGRFLSPRDLAEQFLPLVADRKTENIVVHCGSGVTACHTLLAMDVAGLQMPRLYVGSWSEWSRNEKPIAQGDTP